MTSKYSDLSIIKEFEGLRLKAYYDSVGVLTIGYGHTEGVHLGQVITEEEADEFLRHDVEWADAAIKSLVKVPIIYNQYAALVSFVFNVGTGNFKNSTLLKLLNSGNLKEAAEQFLLWDHAGGHVLKGLTNRRQKERALFLKE